MQRVALFQVGDIHYPDHEGPDADIKDQSFPQSVVDAATSRQLQNAVRELLACLASETDPILIFNGDLTSRGDQAAYGECVEFLNRALLLDQPDKWPATHVHVVPGNHDVNRDFAAKQPADDLYTKFEPLHEAWRARSLDVIATSVPRITRHVCGTASLTVIGLNSCFGCGEARAIPDATFQAIAASLATEGVDDEATGRVLASVRESSEIIDAPAFMADHIDTVHEEIRNPASGLPVLIAHHNILQQALPRFDLYTDLVNAGMFRSRLSGLGGSALYLHGHIHSDPIETVEQSTPDRGQLVCISSPEFVDGFNMIEVWFTDDGTPLGCIVYRYRTRLHGGFSPDSSPVRISFLRGEAALSQLARRVAALLLQNPGLGLVSDVSKALGDDIPSLEIATALKEVEWLGLVEILSPERPPKSWRLRVVNTDD